MSVAATVGHSIAAPLKAAWALPYGIRRAEADASAGGTSKSPADHSQEDYAEPARSSTSASVTFTTRHPRSQRQVESQLEGS